MTTFGFSKAFIAGILLSVQAQALEPSQTVFEEKESSHRLYQDFDRLRSYTAGLLEAMSNGPLRSRFVTKLGVDQMLSAPLERNFIGSYGGDQKFCYHFPLRQNGIVQCRPSEEYIGQEILQQIPIHTDSVKDTINEILDNKAVGLGHFYKIVRMNPKHTRMTSYKFEVTNDQTGTDFPTISLQVIVDETIEGIIWDSRLSKVCEEHYSLQIVQVPGFVRTELQLVSKGLMDSMGCTAKAKTKMGAVVDGWGFSELRAHDSYWGIKSD